jgi:hypothetical protein
MARRQKRKTTAENNSGDHLAEVDEIEKLFRWFRHGKNALKRCANSNANEKYNRDLLAEIGEDEVVIDYRLTLE